MADRLKEYLAYHRAMLESGDMDPAYAALLYVCRRFELNPEQRYWLAWLYAASYCGATAFYAYNEFPDAEVVDPGRLARWWAANRHRLVFQTDRRWVRSRNQFCAMFDSYRAEWAGGTQAGWFSLCKGPTPEATYDAAMLQCGRLYQFGRFALFLYLEAVHTLTGLPMSPTGLDLADSESSRNGLCYACGLDGLLTGTAHGRPGARLKPNELRSLDARFRDVLDAARAQDTPDTRPTNVWNVETSLCAFRKFKLGKRYVGYYLDREHDEIARYERAVPEGVYWKTLWDHRAENLQPRWLKERRPDPA